MDNSGRGGRHDRHHCRCFSVDVRAIDRLRKGLVGLGFEPQALEMPHGQVWGVRLRTSDHEQIHIKAMPSGIIESEAEPPPEYPLAHTNPEHSYSPHRNVEGILRRLRVPFQRVRDIPSTCRRPVIVRPMNYVGWLTIVGGIALTVIVGLGVWAARRR